MSDDLTDDVLRLRPASEHPVLRLLLGHGVSDVLAALREGIANAIDAVRADPRTCEDPTAHILIVRDQGWIAVIDPAGGIAGDMRELLLSPARTSKAGAAHQIGRMGVGFLSALSAMRWAHIVTSTAGAPLSLGPVPAAVAAVRRLVDARCLGVDARSRGTIVVFGPHTATPTVDALVDSLRHRFPFTPVPLRIRESRRLRSDIELVPRSDPWAEDDGWQSCLREVLGLPPAVWTGALRGSTCRVIAWALAAASPEHGGCAAVFQQGGHMLSSFRWETAGAPLCPPWLHLIVDTNAVKPLISRTGVAAGEEHDRLVEKLRAFVEGLLTRPPKDLLVALPRLQRGFGDAWFRWLARLDPDHPLRLESRWRVADGRERRLGELAREPQKIRLIVGATRLADMLWEDLTHRREAGVVDVRARSDDERDVLVGSLRHARRTVELVDFAGDGPPEPGLATDPGVRRVCEAVGRRLAEHGVAVVPVRLGSPDAIGVAERVATRDPAQASYLGDLLDLRPDAPRQQATLFLNEGSRIVHAAGQAGELGEGWSLLLFASALAQGMLPAGATPALEAALTKVVPMTTSRRERKHARVFLIAPFGESELLAGLREVMEGPQWFAEVERADDGADASTILEHVKARIDEADTYVIDIREARPNIMFELGYVFGRHPTRRYVLIAVPGRLPADIGGHMVIEPPPDGDSWTPHLRRRLPPLGLGAQAMLASEPFLHLRHLPADLRERAQALDLRSLAHGPTPADPLLSRIHRALRRRIDQFNHRFTLNITSKIPKTAETVHDDT